MNKKRGYILYIDILGYKNLLTNHNERENEKLRSLLEQFTEIYLKLNFSFNFGQKYEKSKLLKRYFSDNFLFVYESEKEDCPNLLMMLGVATQIQYQFLCCGILTRGSITYGEIEYSDEIVFGCDLIKAVELENHLEPSVLIDEELRNVLVKNGFEFNKHNSLFWVHGNSELDWQDVIEGISKYLEELNKIKPDKKLYEKINWVVEKMNEHFRETKNKCSLQFDSSVKLIIESEEQH